jgi:membrane associated rhomboid family serine protease
MMLFGFLMPGIDNYAHAGGFGGGYLAARWLDPLQPERIDHVAIAVGCLALSLASVAASVFFGLGYFD